MLGAVEKPMDHGTMTEVVTIPAESTASIRLGRWWQLILGVICMSMIANLQYGWTLFVNPIHDAHGWSVAAIQVAVALVQPVEGGVAGGRRTR